MSRGRQKISFEGLLQENVLTGDLLLAWHGDNHANLCTRVNRYQARNQESTFARPMLAWNYESICILDGGEMGLVFGAELTS